LLQNGEEPTQRIWEITAKVWEIEEIPED